MNVGIDRLSFYTPFFYLNLFDLAKAQGKPEDTYIASTGQHKMAVPMPNEDIITMAANAAKRILLDEDKEQISLILFATESGIDQSKASGLYIHQLLNLPLNCRIVELKQACCSATTGLQLAISFLKTQSSHKKVLLIASDIARYELNSSPESSQGAGAVAMLLSQNPRILAIEDEAGYFAQDAMDFWRPNYRREAFVNGKLSCDLYLKGLKESWLHYQMQSGRSFNDHAGFCYHVPIPRLAEKGHQRLARQAGLKLSNEETSYQMQAALYYPKEIGNSYTASLYISLISWLNHSKKDLARQRIGLYSYGSGCTAEYFSGIIQPGYSHYLDTNYYETLLKQRKALSYEEYQSFFSFTYPTDGTRMQIPQYPSGSFTLDHVDQHQRVYREIEE